MQKLKHMRGIKGAKKKKTSLSTWLVVREGSLHAYIENRLIHVSLLSMYMKYPYHGEVKILAKILVLVMIINLDWTSL